MNALCTASEPFVGSIVARLLRTYLGAAGYKDQLIAHSHLLGNAVDPLYIFVVNIIVTDYCRGKYSVRVELYRSVYQLLRRYGRAKIGNADSIFLNAAVLYIDYLEGLRNAHPPLPCRRLCA